jgi:GNAT superfamily N-acetyltransferase
MWGSPIRYLIDISSIRFAAFALPQIFIDSLSFEGTTASRTQNRSLFQFKPIKGGNRAELSDAEDICKLQHRAFRREADERANSQISSVRQVLDEIRQDFARGPILKAVNKDKEIVGSIRASVHTDGWVVIRKFFVKPDMQPQGIGSQPLEAMFPTQNLRFGVTTFREPRSFYEKRGRRGRSAV